MIQKKGVGVTTRLPDRQARRLVEVAESSPKKTFRSAAAAVRFLKKDKSGKP